MNNIQYITLTDICPNKKIQINKEKYNYQVIDAVILETDAKPEGSETNFQFRYELSKRNSGLKRGDQLGTIYNFEGEDIPFRLKRPLNQIESGKEYDFLEIYIVTNHTFKIKIGVSNINIDIELKDLFQPFKSHINISNNSRILFSAPFGQGKTTFLNEFFDINSDEYETFRIYPVNYSVTPNEDIFKYIKAELLFQLQSRDLDFNQLKLDYFDTLPVFIKCNLNKILAPLLMLLPEIGNNMFDIYKEYSKLTDEYSEFHSEVNKDDKKITSEYIETFYNKEGSIYEENIFTQIICSMIEQVRTKEGKKSTVLIIDDLDRMDPEHIFRILNVFSAHFDNDFYNFQEKTNKFGFDKIIIVCDLRNIQSIYHHKYGHDCRFDGYINKYYSFEPYHFSNTQTMVDYISKIKIVELDGSLFKYLKYIITDFIYINEFSIRNLKNLLNTDLSLILNGTSSKEHRHITINKGNHQYFYIVLIYYLQKVYDPLTLKSKIERCVKYGKPINDLRTKEYDKLVRLYGFYALVDNIPNNGKNEAEYKFNGLHLRIRSQESNLFINGNFPYFKHDILSAITPFSFKDFYEVLLLNIERYEQLGGLYGRGDVLQ